MIPQPNDEIWYTTDNKRVLPNGVHMRAFRGKVISNTYADGKGILKFKSDVTEIGNHAFCALDNLTSVSIPASVKHIGKQMIWGCGCIKALKVDENNKVYDSRNNCNAIIETATNTLRIGCNKTKIPPTVKRIAANAFAGCYFLKTVKIPSSVKEIGDWAFYNCRNLSAINLPSSIKKIGTGAFLYCKFTLSEFDNAVGYDKKHNDYWGAEIYDIIQDDGLCIKDNVAASHRGWPKTICLPEGLTEIGENAFYNCSFRSISIPKTITHIEGGIFNQCDNLKTIHVEEGNPQYDSRENCNAIIETATNTLIVGCKGSHIPDSISHIGKDAFGSGCRLKSIVIPNSVVSIENSAFYACIDLKSIIIPSSVKTMGTDVFTDCVSLYSVYVCWRNPIVINEDVFVHQDYKKTGLINLVLYVPKGTAELYRSAAVWKEFAEIKEWNAPE